MSKYDIADDVRDIAEELMNTIALDKNIKQAKIVYLYVLQKKSDYIGKIQRPAGAWKFLSDYDFVILVHKDTWDNLSDTQKKALVYHELLHVTHKTKDEKIIWKLRKHDIEEFLDVIKKFGAWSSSLKQLSKIEKE